MVEGYIWGATTLPVMFPSDVLLLVLFDGLLEPQHTKATTIKSDTTTMRPVYFKGNRISVSLF